MVEDQLSCADTVRLPDDDRDAFTCHRCELDYQFCECPEFPPCDLHNDPLCPWCGDDQPDFDGDGES